jgi:hypothetical protein
MAMPSEVIRPYSIEDPRFVLITPGKSLYAFKVPKTNQEATWSDPSRAFCRPRDSWGQEAVLQLFYEQAISPTCKTDDRCCCTMTLSKFIHSEVQSAPQLHRLLMKLEAEIRQPLGKARMIEIFSVILHSLML